MKRQHIDFLDHFRGIAILLVFLFHSLIPAFNTNQLAWNGWVRDFNASKSLLIVLPATLGWSGVAIFFVISGFCIHLSFQRTPAWKEFFVRRFFRIYPPYLLALMVFALAFPRTRLPFTSLYDYAQLFSHILLIHNLDPRSLFGIAGSFWSIGVEAHLYLLYPALLLLTARWGWRRGLAVTAVVELSFRFLGSLLAKPDGDTPNWIHGLPFTYWFSWALGVAVAEAYVQNKKLPFVTWSFPLVLCVSVISAFVKPLSAFSFFLFSLVTAIAISKLLAGVRFPIHVPTLCSEHLRVAGLWSYSIYLLHQPLVEGVPQALAMVFPGAQLPPLATYAICASSWFIVVPIAALWYRLCELPSIALGKRFIRPPPKL